MMYNFPEIPSSFNTVGVVAAGSRTYLLHNEDSDFDYKFIYVDPLDCYMGLSSPDSFNKVTEDLDIQGFEVRKYCSLLLASNPNILETLFLKEEEQDDNFKNNFSLLIKNNFNWFISQKIYNPYIGYALQQYKRTFGKTTGQLGEKRKNLILNYGYDTKFASHTIRLLSTLNTLLDTGVFSIIPKDVEYIKKIKNGKIALNEYTQVYNSYLKLLEMKWEKRKNDLPREPNFNAVNKFLIDFIINYYKLNV